MKKSILFLLIGAGMMFGQVRLGIDNFIDRYYQDYKGKKIGLITNSTGLTSAKESTIDALAGLKDPKLVKLYGPEHGIRGDVYAGDHVDNTIDKKTNLPVYSLYGKSRKPNKDMLEGIDVLFYDIQDIGSRAYTYIYTMAYAMQAAAENNIEFVVLDRPIALYGNLVDGNVLDTAFSSFVGMYPIPFVYGMTPGELASFFNDEFAIHADLKVIPMDGYNHNMLFEDTGIDWILPSPHIPYPISAYYCAATGCIGELHTISVGIGYTIPFGLVGTDWIDGNRLAVELNRRNLPGVFFRPMTFMPFYHEFKDVPCSGVQIHITDKKKFMPFEINLHILHALNKLYPDHDFLGKDAEESRIKMFNKVMGTDKFREMILKNKPIEEIIQFYQDDLNLFKMKRKEYLLYPN